MHSSIRHRLYAVLGLSLIAIWTLVVIATSWVVRVETEEIFDSGLQETGQRLLSITRYEFLANPHRVPGQLDELSQHSEYLSYQLVDADKRVLIRSHTAPATPLPIPLVPGFHTIDGERFYVDVSSDRLFYILLAERKGHHQEAFSTVFAYMLIPLLAFLPLATGAIQLAVRWAQLPIRKFDREISLRSGSNLQPLTVEELPEELVEVGKAVNLLLERLRLALEAERNFTSQSAHELRTPLAAAMAQLKVLENELNDVPGSKRVGRARETLDRLHKTTVKLLQLARAESGVALSAKRFDLTALVEMLCRDLPHEDKVRFTFTLHDDSPLWVLGDIDALAIAVQNLLENALRYASPVSRIEIVVTRQATLVVHNDCQAVPPEQLAQLGQRFVRASPYGNGFGLGLSITQTIVRQSGGTLTLESPCYADQRGFQATLQLPLAKSTPNDVTTNSHLSAHFLPPT